MNRLIDFLDNLFPPETLNNLVSAPFLRIAILIGVGLPLVWTVSRFADRAARRRVSAQSAMLVRKSIFYTGFVLIAITVTYELGFKLTAIAGVAGIAGIAIGFASQTSFSNIISGLFLISEKPFEVGDIIRIDDLTGTVLSVDLLSLKLRTFDNQFVRIPNETIMKTRLANVTRFPLRRLDLNISVAYREDVHRVRDVLADVARLNPHVLDEPEPLILMTGLGESGVDFLLAAWCVKEDFLQVRKTLLPEVKKRLDAEGIEIPFPHRSLYAGSETAPLPIRLVEGELSPDPD
ncbi:MAG: mechanosensitive ion channel family protein [Phycisphaeraceae bacterium]|nr:mechanosensitive ion channel family protein [Phycisphaeraceae bacterium]